MSHFLTFCGEVSLIVLIWRGLDGHLVNHFKIESSLDYGLRLFWIFRQKPNFGEPNIFKQLNTDSIVT